MTSDGKVCVSPQVLYAMASEIDAHAARIEVIVQQISRTLEMLSNTAAFEGESADLLRWQYYTARQHMLSVAQRVRAYGERLRIAGEAIEKADLQSAKWVPPATPTFLAAGGTLVIRRTASDTSIWYRSPNGKEYPLSDEASVEDALAQIEKQGELADAGKEFFNMKLQHVSASHRARAYVRRFPGWADLSDVAGKTGVLIESGLIGYAGYRWAMRENGDYYQTTEYGRLANNMQIVQDVYVERDADEDFVGNIGGAGGATLGGIAAGAVALYLVGAPVTVPTSILLGAATIAGTLAGGYLGEQGAIHTWRATLNYEPDPQPAPSTDLRFTAHGVEGRATTQSIAEGGRIDLSRLLDGDGEVTLQRDYNGRMYAEGAVTGEPSQMVYLE